MDHSDKHARSLKKTVAIFVATAMLGSVLAAAVFLGQRAPMRMNALPKDALMEGCWRGRLAGDMIVTHGFELHCKIDDRPNNLKINWNGSNHFHLDRLTNVKCIDDPKMQPQPPTAPFDRCGADGYGSYNGVPGYQIHFEFTDAGEPGTKDTALIVIHGGSPDTIVLVTNAFLENGNHQAHKA